MNRYITKHARKATAAVCTAAILLGTPVLAANADDTVKTSDALEVTGNGTVTAVPGFRNDQYTDRRKIRYRYGE